MADPVFSFDLGSPYAWLTAERIDALLAPRTVVWEPVLLGGLFAATGRSSWARAGDESRAAGIAEIERRARDRGLPQPTWPDGWPSDYLLSDRAATAVDLDRGQDGLRTFALAAFRAAFVDGEDLSTADGLGRAAARAGLDPALLILRAGSREVKDTLRARTDAALARGVVGVPSVTLDGVVHFGDDALDALAT